MTIKVMYSEKDFFGRERFAEDTKEYATMDDLKKALRAMKKDHNFAIHINDNFVLAWDSIADFKNDVVTLRNYAAWNSYDECRISWEKMKKYIMREFA